MLIRTIFPIPKFGDQQIKTDHFVFGDNYRHHVFQSFAEQKKSVKINKLRAQTYSRGTGMKVIGKTAAIDGLHWVITPDNEISFSAFFSKTLSES